MTDEAKEAFAMTLYDTYCMEVGGKAWNGDDLPNATEFFGDPTKAKQVEGWKKVADVAISYLTEE